jgi:hypothetical protein
MRRRADVTMVLVMVLRRRKHGVSGMPRELTRIWSLTEHDCTEFRHLTIASPLSIQRH